MGRAEPANVPERDGQVGRRASGRVGARFLAPDRRQERARRPRKPRLKIQIGFLAERLPRGLLCSPCKLVRSHQRLLLARRRRQGERNELTVGSGLRALSQTGAATRGETGGARYWKKSH